MITTVLQEGNKADTLDLIQHQNDVEKLLLTFQKDTDYRTPEDISAEAFEACLGHDGFRLYKRCYLGATSSYYVVEYYTIADDLKFLAWCWGDKHHDYYEIDVDDDGTKELICNVRYIADGAEDVFIYYFNGEQVLMGYGIDLSKLNMYEVIR